MNLLVGPTKYVLYEICSYINDADTKFHIFNFDFQLVIRD
jgi:hypothetical protein